MRKYRTFPTVMEDLKRISITELKKDGYLEENTEKLGYYTWSRGKEITYRLCFKTFLIGKPENYYLVFRRWDNDKYVGYRIRLVAVPSNLGKGKGFRWYFLCPFTGKKCLKLYLYRGYFRSRESLGKIMYEDQNRSKPSRIYVKAIKIACECLNVSKLFDRDFRRYYGGKKTRIYKAYLKQNERLKWSIAVMGFVD